MRTKSISAVIFDLFGTLVNDFLSWAGPMHTELSATLGVPHEPFMLHWRNTSEMRTIGVFQTVEASIEYVCTAMGAKVTSDQVARGVEIRLSHTRRALKPRPNAIATLTRLKHQGYRVGLISNCSIEIPFLWEETEFADLIESPIFSCRERLKKPDPRIYHLACERLGVVPRSCLYVADGEVYELSSASQVGMHPVLIRTSSQEISKSHQEAREWQGTAIADLADLLQLAPATDE